MRIQQSKVIQILSYGYILAPAFLFFVCWSKPIWAIAGGLIIIISFFLSLRESWGDMQFKFDASFALLLILIAILVHYSGVGGFAYQNTDLPYRNRFLLILMDEPWPVSISYLLDGVNQQRGLIYYIGFWLPAAFIGKLTHSVLAAFLAVSFWTALGLFLTWYLLCRYQKQFRVSTLLLFLFFGGLDIIGVCIMERYDMILPLQHIEWWSGTFQFSSFMTQLFWVFNQAIYAWIITLMILLEDRNKHLVLIFSCGLLNCTLPFVGMLPFLIYKIIDNMETFPRVGMKEIKELFTFENVIGGGFIGILSFLYLFGNESARVNTMTGASVSFGLKTYVVFIFLEALIYFPFIYHKEKRTLFWVTLFTLLLCPLIKVGYSADFCMRASIPALVVLFLFVADALQKYKRERQNIKYILLVTIFLLGCISSTWELGRSVWKTSMTDFFANIQNSVTEEMIMNGSNFSGGIEENMYYRFFADIN